MITSSRLGFITLLLALTIGLPSVTSIQVAAAQTAPGQVAGIVVSGFGRVSEPAALAEIQFLIGRDFYEGKRVTVSAPPMGSPVAGESDPAASSGFVPFGSPPLTESDLAPVIDAITSQGLARERIQVFAPAITSMYSGPVASGGAQLRFTIFDPTAETLSTLVAAVSGATTAIGASVQHIGVHYARQDCNAMEAEALAMAVNDAKARAESMAAALGVDLGPLTQAAETGYFGFIGLGSGVTCDPVLPETYSQFGSGMLPPFDPSLPVEAVVYAQVTLTYAMSTTPAA